MKITFSKIILVVLLLIISPAICYAGGLSDGCIHEISPQEKNKILWNTNLTDIGIITVWGITNWDYFTESPKATSEG